MTTSPTLSARDAVASLADFEIGPASIDLGRSRTVALVGPNGSGKSTLIRTLTGQIPLDSGELTFNGSPFRGRDPRVLRSIGEVPDDPDQLMPQLTSLEYWRFCAATLTTSAEGRELMVDRALSLADALHFSPPPRALIGGFSHGMKKKTQIAGALMRRPDLLILDEPRNGLDPLGIAALERLLDQYTAEGGTLLVATHDLHWAERVADDVIILSGGKLLASGAKSDLCNAGESVSDLFFRLVQLRDTDSHGTRRVGA